MSWQLGAGWKICIVAIACCWFCYSPSPLCLCGFKRHADGDPITPAGYLSVDWSYVCRAEEGTANLDYEFQRVMSRIEPNSEGG